MHSRTYTHTKKKETKIAARIENRRTVSLNRAIFAIALPNRAMLKPLKIKIAINW